MMVAYYQIHNGESAVSLVPSKEVDFSRYLMWEAPIALEATHYRLESDMNFISQITEFGDPRLMILDYCNRTGSVITALWTPNRKGPATLELMRKVWHDPFKAYDWATWYTERPCPVKNDWNECLRANLPIYHVDIILMLDANESVEDTTGYISVVEILKFPKRNVAWWKSKTAKQKRFIASRKKADDSRLASGANIKAPKIEDTLMNVGLDETAEMWNLILENYQETKTITKPAPPTKSDWLPLVGADLPVYAYEESSGEDENLPQNVDGDEDEAALIAAALDRYGYPSDGDENWV